MKILAYSSKWENGKALYTDHQGEHVLSNKFFDIIAMLCETQMNAKLDQEVIYTRICWNIDEFVAPLLRLMSREFTEEFLEFSKNGKIVKNNFSMYYTPRKSLTIRFNDGKRIYVVRYFDLAQYYDSIDVEPANILHLKQLGDMLMASLNRIGLYPSKLSSPAKIFEECVLEKLYLMPTAYDIPKESRELVKYAYQCTDRPWIECHQIGCWQESFDYDIASAYPYQAMQLYSVHPNHCKIKKMTRIPSNAEYGYMRGKIKINPEFKIHPFVHRDGSGKLKNRGGEYEDFITLEQYRFMQEFMIGDFEIYDGWFIKVHKHIKPFENVIDRLFRHRVYDGLANNVIKRGMVGMLGKLIEHRDKTYGKWFNPIYSAEIQTRTSMEVARFIYKNKINGELISVNTDGCLLSKKVKTSKAKSINSPGYWKLTEIGPAIAISSGHVLHGDKKPRGVTFDGLLKMIGEKPEDTCYQVWLGRKVSLNDVREGKASVGELAMEKKFVSNSVDLAGLITKQKLGEIDRVFEDFPSTGRELIENKYKSEPLKGEGE